LLSDTGHTCRESLNEFLIRDTSCAQRPAYISSHDTHWRRWFEQRRGGAESQRGETGHQHVAARPSLADAEAERASRIKGAGSHGQDSKLVSPLGE